MSPIRLMATTGILGYGFTEEAFNAGIAMKPDLIACDAGSSITWVRAQPSYRVRRPSATWA